MAGVVPKSTESGESAATKAYSLAAISPTRFDKYTLIGKLGHGGMAEVNLAVVEGKGGFRKLVVIKRLHKHLAEEPGFVDMFLDEARLAARLNHPHVVGMYGLEESDGKRALVLELVEGETLHERLVRGATVSSGRRARFSTPRTGAATGLPGESRK